MKDQRQVEKLKVKEMFLKGHPTELTHATIVRTTLGLVGQERGRMVP